LDGPLVLVKCY